VFIEHAREIRVSGATGADKSTVLAARSSGVIAALEVTKGSSVGADQLVMQLEGPDTTAALETAKAVLQQRTKEADVAEKLFAQGNTSDVALQGARSAKAAAQAQVSQALAAADRLLLRAPFGGIVDSVNVELGEWIQPGTPVATILSLDPIVVRADVSELDIGYITTGATAKVRLVNGRVIDGTVRFVGSEASAQTRTYPVEVEIPNTNREILAGMTAEVSLFAAPVKAVAVPRSVITLNEQGELGLRVVDPDGVASFIAINLIDDTPDGLIVTGVPDNVRIVVSGQDLIKDGEKVLVVEETTAATTSTVLK
jgi:multidrug efflux system membrane fusion protein